MTFSLFLRTNFPSSSNCKDQENREREAERGFTVRDLSTSGDVNATMMFQGRSDRTWFPPNCFPPNCMWALVKNLGECSLILSSILSCFPPYQWPPSSSKVNARSSWPVTHIKNLLLCKLRYVIKRCENGILSSPQAPYNVRLTTWTKKTEWVRLLVPLISVGLRD